MNAHNFYLMNNQTKIEITGTPSGFIMCGLPQEGAAMSDTPRTDNACGWPWGHHGRIEFGDLRWSPDGPFVHSSVARQLERENAELRRQAIEVLMIGRAWIAVWFDHLSPASVEQFITLEKQILKQGNEPKP